MIKPSPVSDGRRHGESMVSINARHERQVFWAGFLAFASSFLLICAGGAGVIGSQAPRGYDCAVDTLLFPVVYVHLHGLADFLRDGLASNISITISGYINPVFLVSLGVKMSRTAAPLFRMVRGALLFMMPFCWIAFFGVGMHPREGYFFWTVGMLLVLFSSELAET